MATIPDVNPNIDGSTVDPKWIDGGPHNIPSTVAPIRPGPSFSIDQPEMWTPASVISGLVSGYCERLAVTNPVFITGTTTVTINNQPVMCYTNKYWGGTEAKEKITSYGVNNIMAGSPIASMFYSSTAPAEMTPVGTRDAETNPGYMTVMDSALTTLCSVFVDEKNKPYVTIAHNGFTALAQSAYTRAGIEQLTTSSIDLPVSNGGTMCTLLMPALPEEWAKERKWMLDELRYVDLYGNIRQAIGSVVFTYIDGTYTKSGSTVSLTVTGGTHTSINSITPTVYAHVSVEATGSVHVDYDLDASLVGAQENTAQVSYWLDSPISEFGINEEAVYIDYNDGYPYGNTKYISTQQYAEYSDEIWGYYVLPGGHLIIPTGVMLEWKPITVESSGILEYTGEMVRLPDTYYTGGNVVLCNGLNDLALYASYPGVTGPGALEIPPNIQEGDSLTDGEVTWDVVGANYAQDALYPTIYLHDGGEFRPYLKDKGGYKIIGMRLPFIYNAHTCRSFVGSEGYATQYISGTDLPTATPPSSGNLMVTDGAVVTLGQSHVPDSVVWLYVSGGTVIVPRDCYVGDVTVLGNGYVEIEAGARPEEHMDVRVLSGGCVHFKNTVNHGGRLGDVLVVSGGTFSFAGVIDGDTTFSVDGLFLTNGAVVNGTLSVDTDSARESSIINRRLEIAKFDDFGLLNASTVGWYYKDMSVVDAASTVNQVYNAGTAEDVEAQVRTHIASLPDNTGIDINVVVNGHTYGSVDDWVTGSTLAYNYYYGAQITAVNKQGGPAAENYYPSFRCRQWYRDKNKPTNAT